MVRKLENKRQCRNLNELYIMFTKALELKLNLDITNDIEKDTIHTISKMEGILSTFSELKSELTSIEKEIGFTNEVIRKNRRTNSEKVKKDIEEMLLKVREGQKNERGD